MSDKECVITGCIARNLLDQPTFTGPAQTREQLYELTVPYARIMASKLKGRPLLTEHEGGSIGEILESWVTDNNQWWIKAHIDRNSRAGNDMIKAMLDQDNPFPEAGQIAELSLCHQGLKPIEVSMVMQGARAGSTIEGVELVDASAIEAIKRREYNHSFLSDQSHQHLEPPLICASFNNMTSYISVRKPDPPVQYVDTQNLPEEARGILNNVAQMKQQTGKFNPMAANRFQSNADAAAAGGASSQQQQEHQQQQQPQDPQQERQQLIRKLQQLDAKHPPPDPKAQQFDRLINKLSGDPAYAHIPSSNIHTLHANPADDDEHLMNIANVFQNPKKNFMNKQEMETGQQSLLRVAEQQRQLKDEIAARDEAMASKDKELERVKAELALHQNDIKKQREQTAAMIAKLVRANNRRPSPSDHNDLDSFQNDFSAGKFDQSMATLQPQLIKASAFADDAMEMQLQAAAAAHGDADMDTGHEESHGSGSNVMSQLQQILHSSNQAPMIKASGYKRRADTMASSSSAAGGSSSQTGMWNKNTSGPFINPDMANLFARVEAKGVDDKVVFPDCMNASDKKTKY